MEDGTLDPRLPPLVARSWQECRCRGVDPWRRSSTTADPGKWQQILQRSRLLLQTAGPIMQSVHEIIRDSHFLLALTDEEGYVLSTIGDDAILARSENILFRRGSVWRNDQVGTNAPGIALEYNQPVQLIGAEHYCADQHGWTCSAAPIHGVDGAVIGSLDLSGSAGAAHPHTLALVVACASSCPEMYAGSVRPSPRLPTRQAGPIRSSCDGRNTSSVQSTACRAIRPPIPLAISMRPIP